jgi:hypothetical protein
VLLATMSGVFVLVLLVPHGRWFFAMDLGWTAGCTPNCVG